MNKMKPTKAFIMIAILTALPFTAMGQISSVIAEQVDAASRLCLDLAGASSGLPEAQAKAVATAALGPCYEALNALDAFEKANGANMSTEELNYFYYAGGNVIWITAASEVMKNNGQLNTAICGKVIAAETAWGNVRVPLGTKIDIEMRTNTLRAMLLPACQQAQ